MKFKIIDTKEKYIKYKQDTSLTYKYGFAVFADRNKHEQNNNISALFITTDIEQFCILPFHSESKETFAVELDRNRFSDVVKQINEEEYQNNLPLTDADSLAPIKIHHIWNSALNKENINYYVPLGLLTEWAIKIFEKHEESSRRRSKYRTDGDKYLLYNRATEVFEQIERNGMAVDVPLFKQYFPKYPLCGDTVYGKYNLFTTIGRPSNFFGGVNFAALDNDNGCRKSFVSRFGSNGILVSFDYDSFHLRLIADILQIKLPSTNLHEYFGKQYFDKEKLTKDEYEESKKITFQCLYGNNKNGIGFFNSVEELKNRVWDEFNSFSLDGKSSALNAFRLIDKSKVESPSKSKIFNYYIQTKEVSWVVDRLSLINYEIKNNPFRSKLILYTYDSILVDFCFDDGMKFIKHVKALMELPVKVSAGINYGEMTEYK